jgi:hypothetical protein
MAEDGDRFLGTTVRTQATHLVTDQVNEIQGVLFQVGPRALVNNILTHN